MIPEIDVDTIRFINAVANSIVAVCFLLLAVITVPLALAVRKRLAEVSAHTEAVRKLLVANIFITDKPREPDTWIDPTEDRT